MLDMNKTLDEVKDLYHKVLGRPAPAIEPGFYAAFPPGVDPLDHVEREMDELRRLADRLEYAPVQVAWMPQADTYVTPEAFLIHVEIPGITREELKVFVVGGECVVRGERKPPQDPVQHALTVERPFGRFERRFVLPAGSNTERLGAHYREGVLELRIPVAGLAAAEEKKVEVA